MAVGNCSLEAAMPQRGEGMRLVDVHHQFMEFEQ